jgi:SIR2-like protein
MVFFLGAGASAAAPSFLPQPWAIQEAVYDCVAPPGADHRDLIVNSLPEIYHEVLLDLGGDVTREIWRVLSLWEEPSRAPALARFDLGPNLVHHLVVYLSWKAGTPVVTVNFDQMLERAAANLGLRADVGLEAETGPESVAIWKLHGTVGDLRSIRTTLQGITAADPAVLGRVKREFSKATGCLVGYSGHDIDFFPFLCDWDLPEPVFWLSLKLDETTIARFPEPFLGVEAPAEDWARATVEGLSGDDKLIDRVQLEAERRLPSAAAVKDAYAELLANQARHTYENAFPPGSPKRVLAHAMILAALGRNRDADSWVDRYLDQSHEAEFDCRAHLLKSAMAHEFARYADSKRYAERARSLARKQGMRAEATQATLRIDEANRMLYGPPRLPFVRAWEIMRPESLYAIFWMLVHAARLWPRRKVASGAAPPSYSELRATFEYLEHLVRVGAIPQGFLELVLPTTTAHRLGDWYWRFIEEKSYAAGYAFGISNSKKYRLRGNSTEERRRDPLSVLDFYSMVPSPTGACIHHRDVAEELAAEMETLPPEPRRDRLQNEAASHFEAAIAAAQQAGDPSLEVKVMLAWKKIDRDRTWPRRSIDDLLSRIQSPAFTRFSAKIASGLCAPERRD